MLIVSISVNLSLAQNLNLLAEIFLLMYIVRPIRRTFNSNIPFIITAYNFRFTAYPQ